MFVSRKVVSGKPFSKLSCVCLPLGKLVNGKHFSINGKHFPVNGKHFLVKRKIWFGFQESVFPFGCVYFPKSGFREITFQTFLCLFAIRKVGKRKTLSSQRKIWLGFQESVFLENLVLIFIIAICFFLIIFLLKFFIYQIWSSFF
jgi:hypothetical protein